MKKRIDRNDTQQKIKKRWIAKSRAGKLSSLILTIKNRMPYAKTQTAQKRVIRPIKIPISILLFFE